MQYIASLSYGKDSLAMLHIIRDVLDWPLDRIITAEVWATDTIPADLPPMVEFKKKADKAILERWGIKVEHFCATRSFQTPLNVGGGTNTHTRNISTTDLNQESLSEQSKGSRCNDIHGVSNSKWDTEQPQKITYQDLFYKKIVNNTKHKGRIWGWPFQNAPWCMSGLKRTALNFQNLMKVRWCSI